MHFSNGVSVLLWLDNCYQTLSGSFIRE